MYGKLPEVIGYFFDQYSKKEYFSYQYLPIKMPTHNYYRIEERLWPFTELIDDVVHYYKNNYGVEAYQSNYIYLTAKRMYQKNGCGFNRQGWHSDSFMSDDINFLWTDKQSTIFNTSKFNLSQDDKLSLKEMEEQADPQNNITFPLNSILRLNQYVIHKVGEIEEGVRTFVKISFSKDKYDLEGNSHNYLLDYDWIMRPRNKERNIPQQLG
jgi:hypothetical protein